MEGEPQAQPSANTYGVDVKAVEPLIENIPAALKAIREDLSGLKAEVAIEGGGIRGRLDAISLRLAGHKLFSAAILDWKTGRDPQAGAKPGQRLGYASAVEATYGMPAQGYIYAAEIWLATGDILESRFDLDTINGFRARLAEQLKYQSASPGPCCRYCARRHECKEREQYSRSAVAALTELDAGSSVVENAAALWEQSRTVKRALEHYERVVDALIDEHGHLALPDGRRIIHGKKTLDTIDPRKAWPIMRKHGLTNDDLNQVAKVSKTGLLDIIGNRAARGKKAEAKKALMTELDLAGAISRTSSRFRKITN
jgi:hypothetical protein